MIRAAFRRDADPAGEASTALQPDGPAPPVRVSCDRCRRWTVNTTIATLILLVLLVLLSKL
jgi:hypothetical protein